LEHNASTALVFKFWIVSPFYEITASLPDLDGGFLANNQVGIS
jgi:hypothetical protein